MAHKRSAAFEVDPLDVSHASRSERDTMTRAQAHALTRCAPLTPAGMGARKPAASSVWVQRSDRLAVGELRRRVTAYAEFAGLPEDNLAEVQIAVSEALTNVALHAYRGFDEPGDVRVEAAVRAGDLVVCVRDYGLSMGPRPDSPGLGLGLAIIARLSKSSTTRRCEDGGTEVSMTFALPAQGFAAGRTPAVR